VSSFHFFPPRCAMKRFFSARRDCPNRFCSYFLDQAFTWFVICQRLCPQMGVYALGEGSSKGIKYATSPPFWAPLSGSPPTSFESHCSTRRAMQVTADRLHEHQFLEADFRFGGATPRSPSPPPLRRIVDVSSWKLSPNPRFLEPFMKRDAPPPLLSLFRSLP